MKLLVSLTLALALLCVLVSGGELKGHNKPLGSHVDAYLPVQVREDVVTPSQFVEYMNKGEPLILKGYAKKYWKAAREWNDEHLKTKYGDLRFDIEHGKKEDRKLPTETKYLKDFITAYQSGSDNDKYMVDSLPKVMREDFSFLPPIACGGYDKTMQDIVLWFSSGGTSSVLHRDESENIGCTLFGEKTFLFLLPRDIKGLNKLLDQGGHSGVDVDKVDMNRYGMLQGVPVYEAKVQPGDCLYVPANVLHQVRSFSRNLAVNTWFNRPAKFDKAQCGEGEQELVALQERLKITYGTMKFVSADANRKLVEKNPINKPRGGGGEEQDGDDDDDSFIQRDGATESNTDQQKNVGRPDYAADSDDDDDSMTSGGRGQSQQQQVADRQGSSTDTYTSYGKDLL